MMIVADSYQNDFCASCPKYRRTPLKHSTNHHQEVLDRFTYTKADQNSGGSEDPHSPDLPEAVSADDFSSGY
jgi:hypothetical protein